MVPHTRLCRATCHITIKWDSHTVYNNTDHAWAQRTFSNHYEVDGVGYSGTETRKTLFNGAGSAPSYTATVDDF